ncbi:MAG TPA: DUF6647 family protein [Burkholderiales bacterium]|nr:DUF6647 family protein [Burkholderiales bacterium]
MDQSALVSLMVELFAAIRLLSAYPSPEVLPEVRRLPQSEIQRQLCNSRPCRIKAYYHPDRGVVVDETLDFENDPFDRSILLHELVHHLQKTTGKFEVVASFCSRRISEELEAYEIQNRYLSEVHASRRALVMGWTGKCADDGDAARPAVAVQSGGD